jgi:hypothetical protein
MRAALVITALVLLALALGLSASADDSLDGPALIRVNAITEVDRNDGVRLTQGSWIHDRQGRRIGWVIVVCRNLGSGGPLGSATALCDGTYLFPKGRIQAAGMRKSRSSYMLAVTGGTGLYSNAGGVLLVRTTRLNPRTETLLFSLEP